MVAESTPATHQPKAYSYLTMTSQLCVFLGPLVGGALYGSPAGFHWLPIRLSTMPALLPSLVNGIFVMGACIAVVLGVKEVGGIACLLPTYVSPVSQLKLSSIVYPDEAPDCRRRSGTNQADLPERIVFTGSSPRSHSLLGQLGLRQHGLLWFVY